MKSNELKIGLKPDHTLLQLVGWYFKQLLPLTYRSKYTVGDKDYFCVWNMWFGKCFHMDNVEIVK